MKPSANRDGTRQTASSPVAEATAPICAIRSGLTSRTPSTSPPRASGRYMPASPRALVRPPTAPIWAACAARESDSPGTVMYPPLLASISPWTEAGSVIAAM